MVTVPKNTLLALMDKWTTGGKLIASESYYWKVIVHSYIGVAFIDTITLWCKSFVNWQIKHNKL